MSLANEIAGEVLLGKRGIVKSTSVWLPLAVILSFGAQAGRQDAWIFCCQVFVAAACWNVASILVNDLADCRHDRASGKSRWIARLPFGVGILVVVLLYGLGATGPALSGGALTAVVYVAAIVFALSYSLPPVHFKTRGLCGPCCYALSTTVGFAALPWVWAGSQWWILAVVGPAVFLDKFVNLQFHQLVDHDADRSSRARTYAVAVGPERARRLLRGAAALAAVWMTGTLAFVILRLPSWRLEGGLASVIVALAGVAYAAVARRRVEHASALVKELPGSYLGLTYALFRFLPLLLLARLALETPSTGVVLGLAALLVFIETAHTCRYRYD